MAVILEQMCVQLRVAVLAWTHVLRLRENYGI